MSTFADIFKMMLRQPVTVAVFPSALIEPIVELNVAKTVTSSGVTDGCGTNIITLSGTVIVEFATPSVPFASR